MRLEDVYNRMVNSEPAKYKVKTLAETYEPVNEDFKITVRGLPSGKLEDYKISDALAKKIKEQIQSDKYDLFDIMDEWIEVCKWDSNKAKDDLPDAVMALIMKHLDLTIPSVAEQVAQAIKDLIHNKNIIDTFEPALKSGTNDFLSFFHATCVKYPRVKIFNNSALIDDLVSKLIFLENTVSVGPGEVFITLFSEVTNPSSGDLQLQRMSSDKSGKVELKGVGGRTGKISATAAVDGFKAIAKSVGGIVTSEKVRLKDSILDDLTAACSHINDVLGTVPAGTRIGNSTRWRGILQDASGMRKTFNSFASALKKYKKSDTPITIDRYLEALGYPSTPSFRSIRDKLRLYTSIKTGMAVSNFTQYFDVVLGDMSDGSNLDEAVNIICEFSNHDITSLKGMILSAIRTSTTKGAELAAGIIGAIQITDYQDAENFEYVVFFNNHLIPLRMLTIGPFDVKNYADTLQQNLAIIDKITVGPSTGGTGKFSTEGRGGFNITYNGT